MSETENIPTERNGKVYFSNGFFRSTETDGYIGLLFIGTENEYQGKKEEGVSMYFVNDKSDRSGFYFLEKAIIPKLRAMVKNREPKIFSERFSVEPSMEGGMIFRIKSRGLEKEFEISAIEAETLDGWLEYISKSLEDTEKLEKLVNIEEKSNTVLRECIIGMAKSQLINPDNDVYKFSVVSTAEGKKRLDTASILHSFHGAKKTDSTLTKSHYFFQFYSGILGAYRMTNVKESEEKSLSFSGGSYPIRFAVSEDGKPGSITVLNETDFVVLKKFILEPSSFLEASSFSMESEKNGMVTKSGGYKITMENSYQGKTFKNEDTIDFDTWNKLKTLSEEGKYDAMALLLKNVKLEKNKFVSAATTKTMSFSKEEYLTYRVSRSNAGVIDENAVMLQISYQKEDDKYIISMLKGDVRKGGIRYVSASPIEGRELAEFRSKIRILDKYLRDPMIPLLESIEKNYRSVQFFPESKERTIARKGLNEVKNGMSAIFQQDSKRKWKQEEDIFSSDSGKLSIRLFLPSCGTLLNDEVFARKKHLPGVESMRYPVSMTFTDKKNEKSMVSVLDLGKLSSFTKDFIGKIKAIKEGEELSFSMEGKGKDNKRKMTTILARSGKTETGEKKIVVDVKFLNFDSAKKAFIPAKDTASIRCMEAIGADAIEKTTKDMEKNILSVARAATDISKNFISSSFIADYSMWKESEKMIPKIDSIEDTSEEIGYTTERSEMGSF